VVCIGARVVSGFGSGGVVTAWRLDFVDGAGAFAGVVDCVSEVSWCAGAPRLVTTFSYAFGGG
jgi:hypothetical protein